MEKRPAEGAKGPPRFYWVECPYCGKSFRIDYSSANTNAPLEEIKALPYARDVEIFDPEPNTQGKTNSDLTKIGEDFFGGLNYERFGILHMEKGWEIYYCVACCPKCTKLIDVFANFTAGKRLADMWPHLLGKSSDGGSIKLWRPTGTLNSLSEDAFYVLLFFLLVYVGSLIPDLMPYFRQEIFDGDRFRAETAPICWIRGTVIVSLLLLLSLRKKLIGLFRNEAALSQLFNIKTGLAYWSNFAVSRFTGYQKEGHLVTVNAVMLLGGASSVAILIVTWAIVRFGMAAPAPDPYATATGFIFWLIVAYIFGIIVWNFSVVSVYIFRGMKNIPMKVGANGDITEFKLIKRAVRYCVVSICIIVISTIALSMFPIFTVPFTELRWAIIWAQFALIVCFSVLIIRFEINTAKDRSGRIKGTVKVIAILVAYILLRYGIGLSQADGIIFQTIGWLGIVEISAAKTYAELVVFSFLAAYLFYRLTRDILFTEIKKAAVQNKLQWRDEKIKEIEENGTYNGQLISPAEAVEIMKSLREDQTMIRTFNEKGGAMTLQLITILLAFLGPLVALLIEHLVLGR